MEPTRKQHDRTATSVATQQYSSAIFVSLLFKSHKVQFGPRFKINHYFRLNFFKNWVKSEIAKSGSAFAVKVGDLRQRTDPLKCHRKAPRLTDGIIQHID